MFKLLTAVLLTINALQGFAAERPNILWIIVEDMSAHFGCYGEKAISTPNVDQLAAEGFCFERAYATAPICSTSRSALITGMYQTSINSHHHRSGRGTVKISLPETIIPVPLLFRQAGYYTSNGYWSVKPGKNIGKTDYNFVGEEKFYDSNDWAGRKPGQPFFAQIQLQGGKVRDGKGATDTFTKTLGALTPTNALTLPPYYPRTDAVLADWGLTLDACRLVDLQVGEIRARLEAEGILNQTLIMFITDHGVSHARGKQFLYDEGTHIPCIMRGPGIKPQTRRQDLIEHIDLAATALAAAGITKPTVMQAQDVLAPTYRPREAIFSARDRADETVDHIRSVRTDRWLYIRNYLPNRPMLQPNRYKDGKNCVKALRAAEAAGQLNDLQKQLLFAPTRPNEELYDYHADPFQINNLASDPTKTTVLAELRTKLSTWEETTNDHGRTPESDAQYDSDMAEYLGKKGDTEVQRNIDLMKQWAKEGK
jgi:arylsulfatase A-like enzyme